MARKFSSLNEAVAYIRNTCIEESLEKIGETGVEIMKVVTDEQVEGSTGDVLNCIGISDITNDTISLEWQDRGNWFSLANSTYGNHMYAPWSLENGKVWDVSGGSSPYNPIYKAPTTLAITSAELIQKESKSICSSVFKSKGFKVK